MKILKILPLVVTNDLNTDVEIIANISLNSKSTIGPQLLRHFLQGTPEVFDELQCCEMRWNLAIADANLT